MKTATITQAKNGLSALIDRVRGGETILILDRGRPVARLEPVVAAGPATGRLDRLERAGLIRRAVAAPPVHLIDDHGPSLAAGVSLLEAVLAERREGR